MLPFRSCPCKHPKWLCVLVEVVLFNEQNSSYQNWKQYSYERKCNNLHIQGNKIWIAFIIVTQSIAYQPVVREPGLHTYSICNASVHFVTPWNTVTQYFLRNCQVVSSQEILRILWKHDLHWHIHKRPWPIPILNQNVSHPPYHFL